MPDVDPRYIDEKKQCTSNIMYCDEAKSILMKRIWIPAGCLKPELDHHKVLLIKEAS